MNLEDDIIKHKRNAERLFVASLLIQEAAIKHECGWLKPENFTDERYRILWRQVREGKDATQAAIDQFIYTDLLAAQGDMISSMAYAAFAKTIQEDDYLLKAAALLPGMAKNIQERDKNALKSAVDKLNEVSPIGSSKVKTAYEIGLNFSEILGADNLSIKTGIQPFDEATGGFAFQALHIIAARPSVGKSTLAWQILRNMAVQKKRVLYISPEQSATSLWAKAACGASGVDWKKVKTNTLTDQEHTTLLDVSADLMDRYGEYLLLDDRSRITSEEIWQLAAELQPKAIVVDHLSLLADKGDNEVLRLGEITKIGKQIAKEYHLAAIYIQQLSREVTKRIDRRPVMTDLRASGETEQNADTITFIHRDDYYDESGSSPNDWSRTQLIIAKDRDGQRNDEAIVYFNTKDQWFYSRQESIEKGM